MSRTGQRELEGPAARRKQVERDDLRRDLKQKYHLISDERLRELLSEWSAKKITVDSIKATLEKEQEVLALRPNANASEDDAHRLVLYVTNQTGNRHVRYKCNRLRLNFVCLRLEYTEVDVAGNKWLRQKVTESAGIDEIPLLFIGSIGPDSKFLGTYDDILNIIDEGTFYDYLGKFGYVHPHKKCQHFVYTGDTSKMKKIN